jgi:hypothetical protein
MRHCILTMGRTAKGQMRPRRASVFLVLEEPLSMRQLRRPLTSPQYSIASRSTSRARSPACALATDASSSQDLVSRTSSRPGLWGSRGLKLTVPFLRQTSSKRSSSSSSRRSTISPAPKSPPLALPPKRQPPSEARPSSKHPISPVPKPPSSSRSPRSLRRMQYRTNMATASRTTDPPPLSRETASSLTRWAA